MPNEIQPGEAKTPFTTADFKASAVEYQTGEKVLIRYPDGDEEYEGEILGPPVTRKANGRIVRLFPVDQPRMFYSGQVGLRIILVMETFLKKIKL